MLYQDKHISQQELWQTWKQKPNDNNLSDLLSSFNPLIRRSVNKFKGADVPGPSLELEAKRLAVTAFKTYKPELKTNLATHVHINLMGLNRFVGNLQNTARIPEHRRLKINEFKTALNDLYEMNGREPNEQELSDRLKWPIKEVTKMESELRNTLTDYTLEPETVGRMGNITKKEEYFRLLYNELDNTEKLVYEYGVGFGGKPKLNVKEMAKKLNTYPSNIVRIKKSIIKKLNKYMTEGQNLNR